MAHWIFREIISDFGALADAYHMMVGNERHEPPSTRRDSFYEDARKCALWEELKWSLDSIPEFNDELLNRRAKDLKLALTLPSNTPKPSLTRKQRLQSAFNAIQADRSLSFPKAITNAGLDYSKAIEMAVKRLAVTKEQKDKLKRGKKEQK